MCEKIKPFTTDGCSGGMTWIWNKLFKKNPPWNGCCVDHDKPYHKGGTSEDRLKADKDLRTCVTNKGYPKIGTCMFYAVRVGGHPYLPFPWRWGYGYKYGHPYDNEDGLKKFKYILYPVLISNEHRIAVRKRIFHKGYKVLQAISTIDGDYFEELGECSKLHEIDKFMYDRFGVEIKL